MNGTRESDYLLNKNAQFVVEVLNVSDECVLPEGKQFAIDGVPSPLNRLHTRTHSPLLPFIVRAAIVVANHSAQAIHAQFDYGNSQIELNSSSHSNANK